MNQPIARFRAGRISCAIWENEIQVDGSSKTVLKATVERRYKDNNRTRKSTTSFSRNEIPLAVYCLEKAFETIIPEEKGDNSSNGVAEEVVE